MPRLRVDIETFCDLDLRTSNVYTYSEHPSFFILMAAWRVDNGPIQVAFDLDDIFSIPGLFDGDDTVIRVAHNAQFERVCFSEVARRAGILAPGTYLPPQDWHDTMAVCGEYGYPLGLGDAAKALSLAPKDEAGTALINFFCKPNRKGLRNLPEDHPEKWQQFTDYCIRDVEVLTQLDERLGDFPTESEREVWDVDQAINDRGIPADVALATVAVEAATANKALHEQEVRDITGVENPGSVVQLLGWLRASGLTTMTDMTKDSVDKHLATPSLTSEQRRVLELRQELALVASKKFSAVLAGVSEDGRLRGQFRFFGAHTGRWSGRGVQLHNLPRRSFEKVVNGKKVYDELAEQVAVLDLMLGNGADADTLKKMVRPMFIGPFTVVDYAAIEARVIAWLAGEEWALQAFRDGRDIYVETANQMSTAHRKYNRSEGKVAVLALGYQGAVNSLRALGAEGTDAELQAIVNLWRGANEEIVRFWRTMERAFRTGGPVGDFITIEKDEKDRAIVLPSGRALVYHDCSWATEKTQYGERQVARFRDHRMGGARVSTYGGRLTENTVQAVARDVMAAGLVSLEREGYPVVGHVHDEVINEGASSSSLREVRRILTTNPDWAKTLPLDAEGITCKRYRKA